MLSASESHFESEQELESEFDPAVLFDAESAPEVLFESASDVVLAMLVELAAVSAAELAPLSATQPEVELESRLLFEDEFAFT